MTIKLHCRSVKLIPRRKYFFAMVTYREGLHFNINNPRTSRRGHLHDEPVMQKYHTSPAVLYIESTESSVASLLLDHSSHIICDPWMTNSFPVVYKLPWSASGTFAI